MDMHEHAGAVDVGDAQVCSFAQTQAEGVDGGQDGVIAEQTKARQQGSEFRDAQDVRQFFDLTGDHEVEQGPWAMEGMREQKLHSGEALFEETFRIPLDVFHVEEIPANVLFTEGFGRFHIMPGGFGDVLGVIVPGALGQPFQRHVFKEPLSQWRHNNLRKRNSRRWAREHSVARGAGVFKRDSETSGGEEQPSRVKSFSCRASHGLVQPGAPAERAACISGGIVA